MTHVRVIMRAGSVRHGSMADFCELPTGRIASTASRPLLTNESQCPSCLRHMIAFGMVNAGILVRLVIVRRWQHILHNSIQDPG